MFRNFFRRAESIQLPWTNKESIYAYIKSHLTPEGVLPQEYQRLPDDDAFHGGKTFRWAPGAFDSILRHFPRAANEPQGRVKALADLILKQHSNPCDSTRKDTFLALLDDEAVSCIDAVVEYLGNYRSLNHTILRNEASWFAREGVHRNVVKLGIALLSLSKCDKYIELLMTLGKHEEFALYSATAIKRSCSHPNQYLFELAKCVDGWGKIHIVERLSPDSPEIKGWLLRHGCENSIMDEYLAYTCAVNGDLNAALSSDIIDAELYRGASIILSALINGGPAEGIDDYPHAMSAIASFLHHSKTFTSDLQYLITIDQVRNFLETDNEAWERRLSSGWDPWVREDCLKECMQLISSHAWQNQIWENLNSSSTYKQNLAVQAAKIIGIDVWQTLFAQLTFDPVNPSLYYNLMRSDDRNRVKRLIDFAERNLPLEDISSGPGSESGMSPEFKAHTCLDYILQDLHKYEGVGKKLLLAALKSPVIRNRTMALKVLSSWKNESWPEETILTLMEALNSEPYQDLKKRMQELVSLALK